MNFAKISFNPLLNGHKFWAKMVARRTDSDLILATQLQSQRISWDRKSPMYGKTPLKKTKQFYKRKNLLVIVVYKWREYNISKLSKPYF